MSNGGLALGGILAIVIGIGLFASEVKSKGSFESGDTKISGPVFFILIVIGILMLAASSY